MQKLFNNNHKEGIQQNILLNAVFKAAEANSPSLNENIETAHEYLNTLTMANLISEIVKELNEMGFVIVPNEGKT